MTANCNSRPPLLTLAPMEGATDYPMRYILTQIGGIDLCVSEFMRVSHHVPPKRVFCRLIPEALQGWKTAFGTPIYPQLLGGNPERLAASAQSLVEMGAPGIDLNFGCPAKTVNRHDGGSCLLQYPERIYAIVRAVRQATPPLLPVTVKIRLGWENPLDVFRNAEIIEKAGATWLTLHARTKHEGYTGHAHWDLIRDVRKAIGIPLIANGDILSVEDFERCRELTRCEHFMIGRGVLRDPYLFRKIKGSNDNTQDLFEVLRNFFELARSSTQKPNREVGRVKQFVRLMGQRDPRMQEFFEVLKPARTSVELQQAFENSLFFETIRPGV